MNAIQKHIPPGLAATETEIYWDADANDLFALSNGVKYRFTELPTRVLDELSEHLNKDEEALKIFEEVGLKLLRDRLYLWCKCNFGGFSFTPDLHAGRASKECWNCGCAGNCILEPINRGKVAMANGNLTRRELQVLRTLCRPPFKIGAAVADELQISEHTLNRHKSRIFHKCNVQSIQELAVLATKMDLV